MLIAGIVVLMVPVVVLYLNFVEGLWTGSDYDWLGTLSMLLFLGLGVWAIREGLTSSTKISEVSPRVGGRPPPVTPSHRPMSRFCTNCGTPRQPQDTFCGACGNQL
jgi:hypothetical protein